MLAVVVAVAVAVDAAVDVVVAEVVSLVDDFVVLVVGSIAFTDEPNIVPSMREPFSRTKNNIKSFRM